MPTTSVPKRALTYVKVAVLADWGALEGKEASKRLRRGEKRIDTR